MFIFNRFIVIVGACSFTFGNSLDHAASPRRLLRAAYDHPLALTLPAPPAVYDDVITSPELSEYALFGEDLTAFDDDHLLVSAPGAGVTPGKVFLYHYDSVPGLDENGNITLVEGWVSVKTYKAAPPSHKVSLRTFESSPLLLNNHSL